MELRQTGWALAGLLLACGPSTSSVGGTDSATSGASESASQTSTSSTSGSTTGVDPPAMTCTDLREPSFLATDVAVYEDGAVVGGELEVGVAIFRLDADDQPIWGSFLTGGAHETIQGDRLSAVVVTSAGSIVYSGHRALGVYEYFDIDVPIMLDATRWFVISVDGDGKQQWAVHDPGWIPFDPGETPARVSSIIDADLGEDGGTIHLVEVGVQQSFEVLFVESGGDSGAVEYGGNYILSNIATRIEPFNLYTAGVNLDGYRIADAGGEGCTLDGSFLPGDIAASSSSVAAAFTSNHADLNKIAELVVKDADANVAWQESWDPTSLMDFAFTVGIDDAGNIAVAGSTGYDGGGAPNEALAWVKLYDPSGNELWTLTHDEPGGSFRALDFTPDGDIALVGDWNFEQSRICWVRS